MQPFGGRNVGSGGGGKIAALLSVKHNTLQDYSPCFHLLTVLLLVLANLCEE